MSAQDVAVARALLLRRDTQAWMRRRGRAVQPDLPPAVRRQFQEAFALLDSDGSGALDEAEVFEGFRQLNLPTSRAAVRRMVKAMSNDQGCVTYAGFERLMAARKEELPQHGSNVVAPPQVPLAVMARSLRRAKLLNAVLLEREEALREYRRARGSAGAPATPESPAPSAVADDPAEQHPLATSAAPAQRREDAAPSPPPGLHSAAPSAPSSDAGDAPPPAFAFRRPARRRSVLVCVGGMEKLVPFAFDAMT